MKSFLRWTPRILSLLTAGLLALFALDVFADNQGFWPTAVALLLHLIPTGLVLLVLVFSWRWPMVGGAVFIGLAVLYPPVLLAVRGLKWTATLPVAGPLLLAGALFLADWLVVRRHRPTQTTP